MGCNARRSTSALRERYESVTSWPPFDRPLSPSERNYLHRAQTPSDFELERDRANTDVVRPLQGHPSQNERPKGDSGERRRANAAKGAQAAWFGIGIGRSESLRLQAEPALNPRDYFSVE